MHKPCHPRVLLAGITLLLTFTQPAHATCTVTDDIGQVIHLDKPAQRIITLAPDITEIIFAIGAGARVIGVVSGSDYPAAVKRIPQIGSYAGIDLERVISMHPELIVTWSNTFTRQLNTLKKFNIPIYTTQPRQLEDIPRSMQNLGCLVGTERPAAAAARQYTQRLAALRRQYQSAKPVTVFYQIGSYGLLTINKNSWINQVIELCGGRNVFGQLRQVTAEVSWEAVLTANPQVIITDTLQADWKRRWQRFSTITAVKNQAMYAIDPDIIDRAGPRLLDGAAQICRVIISLRSP